MSNGLLVQLRSYGEFYDESLPTITVESVVSGLPEVPPLVTDSSPPPKRRWRIAVAAAAIVAGVIALGLWWQSLGSDGPPVVTQPPPVPTTVPESSPTTVPDRTATTIGEAAYPPKGSSLSWERLDAAPFLGWPSAAGDPFVYLGTDEFGEQVDQLYLSADGARWDSYTLDNPKEIQNLDVGNDLIVIVAVDAIDIAAGEGGPNPFLGGLARPDAREIKTLKLGADGSVTSELTTRLQPDLYSFFSLEVVAVAVGPKGAVLTGNLHFDNNIIRGAEEGPYPHIVDNVMSVSTPEGGTLYVDLSDYGFDESDWVYSAEDNDLRHRLEGRRSFYSADGAVWTQIEPIAEGAPVWPLFAVDEGFFAVTPSPEEDHLSSLWFSPDGIGWDEIECCAVGAPFVEWQNGLLGTDGQSFWHFTSTGTTELQIKGTEGRPNDSFGDFLAASDMGIVVLYWETREVYYSTDGTTWEIDEMPEELVQLGGGSHFVANSQAAIVTWWNPETDEGALWRATVLAPAE